MLTRDTLRPEGIARRVGETPAWRWVPVGVAAAAMVATLPGRTHGLGLITVPLMKDLHLEQVPFAALNFWATLIGAAFCVPAGWVLDRFGLRLALGTVLLALGAVILAMSNVATGGRIVELATPEVFFAGRMEWSAVPLDLFLLVLLTRGLGQSALSVVSLALVGKVAGKKPGVVIGVYSFLVAIGFMGAFAGVKAVFETLHAEWRTLWAAMAWILIGFGVLALLIVREPQRADELKTTDEATASAERSLHSQRSASQSRLLGVRPGDLVLWTCRGRHVAVQPVPPGRAWFRPLSLSDHHHRHAAHRPGGQSRGRIPGNAGASRPVAGRVARHSGRCAGRPFRWCRLSRKFTLTRRRWVSRGACSPWYSSPFGGRRSAPRIWGRCRARRSCITVLASAAGPLVLAAGHRALGSYAPVFQNLAIVAAVFAVAALLVPLPSAAGAAREDVSA